LPCSPKPGHLRVQNEADVQVLHCAAEPMFTDAVALSGGAQGTAISGGPVDGVEQASAEVH